MNLSLSPESTTLSFDGLYFGKRVRAEINIVQANTLAWIKRTRLQLEAEAIEKGVIDSGTDQFDIDVANLHRYVYPDYVAASPVGWITIDDTPLSWPLSFGDFMQLPGDLCAQWEIIVYQLNPTWLADSAEGKKKPSQSGSRALKHSTARSRTKASRK